MKTSWKHHYLVEKMNRESLEERLETEKRIKEAYAKQKQIEFAEEVLKEYKNLRKSNNLNDWVRDFISEDNEVPSDCFKAVNYGAYIASCYFDNHFEWLEQRIKELRK
jgi:midasin (ATPase involved in ribosome maturation)